MATVNVKAVTPTRTVVVDRARIAAITERRPEAVTTDLARTVRALTEQSKTIGVVSLGVQGATGPSSDSSTALQTASTALGGHRVVRSTGANSVGYASSKLPGHGDDTVGLTLGAVNAGDQATVQAAGAVTFNGWAWTPGLPVFVGGDGVLTQIAPSPENGDLFIQPFGHARSADTIYIDIDPSIYF